MLFPPIIFLVGAFTFLGALLFLEKGAGVSLAPQEETIAPIQLDERVGHSPRLNTPGPVFKETLTIDGISFEEYLETVTETYTPSTISPATEEDPLLRAELRAYGNMVGGILAKEIGSAEKQLGQFQAKEYLILAAAYRAAASNLKILNPPPLFMSPQSQFVTAHTRVGEALVPLSQNESPALLNAYNQAVGEYVEALQLQALLFSAAGVVFTEEESGYLFTQITSAGR